MSSKEISLTAERGGQSRVSATGGVFPRGKRNPFRRLRASSPEGEERY